MEAKHNNEVATKTKSSTGKYVIFSLLFFYLFIATYLYICWNIAVLPSDWVCMGFALVTIVECITCAFIKIRGKNTGVLTDNEKDGIQFAIECVGKLLNVNAPNMKSGTKGTKQEKENESDW